MKNLYFTFQNPFSNLRFRVSKKKEENLFNLTCLRKVYFFFEESDSIVEIESKEKFSLPNQLVHQKIKNKRKLVYSFLSMDLLTDVLGINSLQLYAKKQIF